MSFFVSLTRRLWWIAPLLAVGFLVWFNAARIGRTLHVSSMPEWSVEHARIDPTSPTGYQERRRQLINSSHNNDSYQWIAHTQQMLASGEWRLRHVDYDNAPTGRAVTLPSIYQWWMALLAWSDHALTGSGIGLSAERAALWADPALHLLLLLSVTVFVAREFGALAAASVSIACATWFPFAGSFIAGEPDRHGLALLCSLWSVLPLVAGLRELNRASPAADGSTERRVRRWFALGAVAGAFGLWVNVDLQWPVLLGVAVAAAANGLVTRDKSTSNLIQPPWRWWGLCGCAASLLTYAAEHYPDHLSLDLNSNHPLFALSWLGAAELAARITTWMQSPGAWKSRAELTGAGVASILALMAPVAILWSNSRGWLPDDAGALKLSGLGGGIVAPNFAAWLARDGITTTAWVTVLPLLLLGVAVWQLLSHKENASMRSCIVLALGPVVVALPIAFVQLRAWSAVDAMLLVLLAAVTARPPTGRVGVNSGGRRGLAVAVVCLAALGLVPLWPSPQRGEEISLSETELQGVIERDLAHWLARRAGRAVVVVAPPDLTTSLYFHGGLRGIGTLDRENADGFAAAMRIMSATSRDEAATLIQQRDVSYIVVPSWDHFLDNYAELGLRAQRGSSLHNKSLIASLNRWDLPRWLRPVPYRLPTSGAFAGRSAAVFEVVNEQDAPTAAGRLAEYFIEIGRIELAEPLREELRRFPADLGALTGIAQIEAARGDLAGFRAALATLLPYVSSGAERRLPWDRRLALVIVLAQAKQTDAGRTQLERCVADLNEKRLRSLSNGSLVWLQTLTKTWSIDIPDMQLRQLARELLPPDLREEL
jgi:hypothetical protein